MPLPGSTPIFSIGDETFDWADVKTAARAFGDWSRVEADTREGLASVTFLDADENEIESDVLEAATDSFREERNLIAAEEMTQWLAARGIDAEEWISFVERGLARKRCARQLEEVLRSFPVDEADVAAMLDCEAICSGVAGKVARKLAAVAVFAAAEATEPPSETRDEEARRARIERLAAGFDRLRSHAMTDEAIARALELHRLDWTQLECRLASFGSEDAAREAAFCVHEEEADFAQVAIDAGTQMEESTFFLQDVAAEIQAKVLSAEKGHLVGPLPLRGQPTLLIVDAKKSPTVDDPMVKAEAERALVAAAIEQQSRAARFVLEL